jgi:hypothetical protein
MRKRFKQKLRSCKLCKPYKMGWEKRWKTKEFFRLRLAEREILAATGHGAGLSNPD